MLLKIFEWQFVYKNKNMNQVLILAGGKGTRMKSDRPKTLNLINKKTILSHILNKVEKTAVKPCVVVGYKGDEIIKEIGNKCDYVYQDEQLGTGHAVMCAKKFLEGKDAENILVLPGDHPLINSDTLKKLIRIHKEENAAVSLSTVIAPHFENEYKCFKHSGRIIRNEKGEIEKIIEFKDATDEEKNIKEVNVSYYCFKARWLWDNIDNLKNENKAKEYYLTDIIKIAFEQKEKIIPVIIENPIECMGVNTVHELKIAKKYLLD